MRTNDLVIIIVTYNSAETIETCLKSIFSKSLKMEIVVIDNYSSDKTVEIVEKFKEVKLIRNKKNFGFGKANNTGVKISKGEYIFFLNPDCIVEKETVEKLAYFLDNNKNVAAVGPKLTDSSGKLQAYNSPFPTIFSEILVLLRLHRVSFFRNFVYSDYDYEKMQNEEHLMGAALMVRRNIFEEINGFDENIFLWFEETDLLKRIYDKNLGIVYLPSVSVVHLIGQSTKHINPIKKQTIWNKSLLYYFQKHKGWFKLLMLLPFILLSYIPALISIFFKNK